MLILYVGLPHSVELPIGALVYYYYYTIFHDTLYGVKRIDAHSA